MILWWNVLLYLVLALFVLAVGILAISPVLVRLGGPVELLIFIAVGIAAILIPIIRATKVPIDKLPSLDED